MTIQQARKQIIKKEINVLTLVKECLKKIESLDKGKNGVNAVITINKEESLLMAKKADEKIKRGDSLRELEGIPIAVKDVLCTEGLKTTAGSKILNDYVPPYDATVVKKLKEAGAIIIAKTNCDEFAHGASGENSAFGATKNPYDLERVPGGSSSGSGAIVAYGGALASLGTDTGGSSRAPGSFLGLVGLKPTYGRLSRYGLIAMCSSTDTVAPIAQDVTDASILLEVLAGQDNKDSTSSGFSGKNFQRDFARGIKNLSVAYPKECLQEGMHPEVKQIFYENLEKLEENGAKIKEISLPLFGEPALATYYILVPSEISSNLSRFDSIRYGTSMKEANNLKELYLKTRSKYLGAEVKRRIMLGNFALSSGYYDAYYLKAQKVRRLMQEEAKDVFNKFDLIVTPTMATPAFKLGEKSDPLSMYLADIYSVYANLTGICAVSINGGWVKNPSIKIKTLINDKNKQNKLPVGIQFMAKWWDEETLLRGAYFLEMLNNEG